MILICWVFITTVFAFEGTASSGAQAVTSLAETAARFKQFPPTTLKLHRKTLSPKEFSPKKNQINIDPRALSWAFNLKYEGQTQPIAKERQPFIDYVVKQNPQLKGQYVFEVLVSDGEEVFWLPIQNNTLAYFKNEIAKKGDRLFAHTRYFGSYNPGEPKQFFLMLGYRKPLAF